MNMISLYDAISRMSETVGDWVLQEKWKFVWPAKEAIGKIGIQHLYQKEYRLLEAVEGVITAPIDILLVERLYPGDITGTYPIGLDPEYVLLGLDEDNGPFEEVEFNFTQNRDSLFLNAYYTGTVTAICYVALIDETTGMILIPEDYQEAIATYLEYTAMKMMKWRILKNEKMLRSGLLADIQATLEHFWHLVRSLKSNRTSEFERDFILPRIKHR
jgi:hypothetical protein